MSVSEEFSSFVCDQLAGWAPVSVRRMFGGAGLFHRGLMFGLIAEDIAYLKVDDSNRGDFEAAGSRPFRPDRNKKTVLSYYQVPGDILEDAAAFGDWARKAFEAASRVRRE